MRGSAERLLAVCLAILVAGCVASPRFTISKGKTTTDTAPVSVYEEGTASYYAEEFNGRKTSNGEVYNMNDLTAAHQTLPFNTKVRVTNTLTGRSVVVRINDRGPFKDNRVIDLSYAAAKLIDLIGPGTAHVRIDVLEQGSPDTKRRQ